MALFVETPDIKILFDAGISLAPRRFGLPPHPSELRVVKRLRDEIVEYAKVADIITISHYHFDHFTPFLNSWYEWSSPDIAKAVYSNKTVLLKNPEENINFNQAKRARAFINHLKSVTDEIIPCDGMTFSYGSTTIRVHKPVPHGREGSKLGFVLIFEVEEGGVKLVFAPDVQGPISDSTLDLILSIKPDIVIIGGPPVYLAGTKVSQNDVERGLNNLMKIASHVKTLIVSHHLLRCAEYRELLGGIRFSTYAEIVGLEETLLEAFRKELYSMDPPPEEYVKWLKSGRESPPPI